VTPSKLKPLDQVRADALAAWTAQEKAKAVAEKAKSLTEQAQKDGNLAEIAKSVKASVQQSPALGRDTNDATFSSALVRELFNAPPNGVVEAAQGSGGNYIIARVTGISHAAAPASQQLFAGGRAQVSEQAASDFSASLANEARQRQGVTVNQQLLQQAIGGQS
jgi:peptidyl-prolyl cis-trans isomerase D